MKTTPVIGVDLGGTNVRTAKIQGDQIVERFAAPISAKMDQETVLGELIDAIERVFNADCTHIGLGVPSVIDQAQGLLYDVENIPAWEEVPLRDILETHFHVPVCLDNDANCFALGEACFGKGQAYRYLVGVIIGTGLGAGIVMDRQLYAGISCGAGEIGVLPYADHDYGYYCSGEFFLNTYQVSGETLFEQALQGDQRAKDIFEQYGRQLGDALWVIVAAFDPELIILGGAISKAYPFFQRALWERLAAFPFRPTIKRLVIEVSDTPDIALFGAAALCADRLTIRSAGE